MLLGILLLMTANSLQGTLLGVRGAIEAIDTTTMGYIMSGYFAGFLGGSWVVPKLLRRVGHVRVYAALGTSLSVAFLLFAVRVDPLQWLLLRGVVGFCYSGLYIVTESWLNELSDNRTRGQAMSLNMLVQMLAVVVGQWLVNTADPGGYVLFVMISVFVSLSFLPILLVISPTPAHETSRPMSIRELVTLSPLACLGMLLLGTVFATMFGMVAVFATAAGFSVADTASLVMAISLGTIVTQYPIGWLSDRVQRRPLVLVLTAVGALAATYGGLAADGFSELFAVIFVIGGTTTPAYSLLIAHANDRIETDQMAAASAGLLMIAGAGSMTGPVIAGYALSAFGNAGFFLFPAALLVATTLYGVVRMRYPEPPGPRDRSTYMPLTSGTSIAGTELAYGQEPDDEHSDESGTPPGGAKVPVPGAFSRGGPSAVHEKQE